jgi:gas vesicle protein
LNIKKTIESDIKKNKKEATLELVKGIDELLILSQKPSPNKADFENIFNQLRLLQKKAVLYFQPSFSEVLNSLSKKEFEHMKKLAEERFKKGDERLLDTEKFKSHALEKFENNMNILFDDINDQQKKIYLNFIDANYDYYKLQIGVRKDFMKKFELLLDNKPELLDFTLKYYAGDASTKSQDFIKKQNQFFDNAYQLQLEIWNASSEKQKNEFRKTLNEIKRELSKLAP